MRLLALLIALLLAPLTASAQVIHACVKNGGALKIVSNPALCPRNATPLSWNVQGPQGPPGDPGTDGEPGPQGPPGPVLHVFDALGNDLGLFAGRDTPANIVYVTSEITGITIPLSTFGTLSSAFTANLLFADAQCAGVPLAFAVAIALQMYVGARDPRGEPSVLFVPRAVPPTPIQPKSFLDGGGRCTALSAGQQVLPLVPADRITEGELGITLPVANPLRVAPAPE